MPFESGSFVFKLPSLLLEIEIILIVIIYLTIQGVYESALRFLEASLGGFLVFQQEAGIQLNCFLSVLLDDDNWKPV